MVRVFSNGPGDLRSIPGRVIPKTLKMVLDASLLNTQHYKVRIKGKVEKSWERSSVLPYTCSSYRKRCLRVTLDYGRLYLLWTSYVRFKHIRIWLWHTEVRLLIKTAVVWFYFLVHYQFYEMHQVNQYSRFTKKCRLQKFYKIFTCHTLWQLRPWKTLFITQHKEMEVRMNLVYDVIISLVKSLNSVLYI